MSAQLFPTPERPPRPTPDDITLSARVPATLRAQYIAEAERRNLAVSDVVRQALAMYMTTNPLNAIEPGQARRRDPNTSKAAASRVAPRVGSQRRRALEIILADSFHGGEGTTTDEVILALELRAAREGTPMPAVNGVARRVTDLLQAGAIELARDPRTGQVITRLTRHGSEAQAYRITRLGRRWLTEVT